jgi:hypothetical protein
VLHRCHCLPELALGDWVHRDLDAVAAGLVLLSLDPAHRASFGWGTGEPAGLPSGQLWKLEEEARGEKFVAR